jgi:hypothetical protein
MENGYKTKLVKKWKYRHRGMPFAQWRCRAVESRSIKFGKHKGEYEPGPDFGEDRSIQVVLR